MANYLAKVNVTFETLIALAGASGISAKEVVEAQLFHLAAVCCDDLLSMHIELKEQALQHYEPKDITPLARSIYDTEVLLLALPRQLAGIVNAMVEVGALDLQRAHANWNKLEEIIINNLPPEERELALKLKEASQQFTAPEDKTH